MKQRFCVYNGIWHGMFAIPESIHDTPEEAADAARALVLANIPRARTMGDPMGCAVLVLPVPVYPELVAQETP